MMSSSFLVYKIVEVAVYIFNRHFIEISLPPLSQCGIIRKYVKDNLKNEQSLEKMTNDE